MAIMNLNDEISKVEQRLEDPEEMLGKGLMQPFTNTNSGSRKLMFGVQLEHRLPLMKSEVALVQTGYEAEFGRHSSSFVPCPANYQVVAKIPKFSFAPEHHYVLILQDSVRKTISYVERVSYKHITETYGYLYDNRMLDSLRPGSFIEKGTVIQKSQSFDEYNNRMDGVNLVTAYLSCEHTMEDGIIISESAANKLTSPLLKNVSIIINDNDILLNMYGDEGHYKTFPDIGEEINSLLCAIRREKKEESLFTQSYDRLRDLMMSDEKYPVEGKVLDINIYCNNPENLSNTFYNSQLKAYYDESIRFNTQVIEVVSSLISDGYTADYELQKFYVIAKRIINGDQWINDRPFSNVVLNIIVMEENKIRVGDKLSDRYGGKGVVSKILPDNMMPLLDTGERVEVINNQSTCVNRENAGQLFEVSLNHISTRIIQYIHLGVLDVGQCIDMLLQYLELISKDLASYVEETLDSFQCEDDLIAYIGSLSNDEGIFLSIKPMSESMDIDKLAKIYDAFPWAAPNRFVVPIEDSYGKTRYIEAARPIIAGKKYFYRLKQYAEEKFSVTSLSSTNIRNENSRNKSNRSFKSLYTRTPIRFGEMETGDLGNIGMEAVVINLMIHSASPHARRLAEQLYTGDPFNIDIKLDMGAKNRNVEIVEAYLKTLGYKLVFIKRRKTRIRPGLITPGVFLIPDKIPRKPGYFIDKNAGEIIDLYDIEKWQAALNGYIRPGIITPGEFIKLPKTKVEEEILNP